MFGGMDYAAVSQRIRRIQKRAETDKKLKRTLKMLTTPICFLDQFRSWEKRSCKVAVPYQEQVMGLYKGVFAEKK